MARSLSAWRGPSGGADYYRASLVGYGALFFAPHPVAGALFLLGTFAANSTVGAAVLIGILVSTATARLLHRSSVEIEHGLHGFNGALAEEKVGQARPDSPGKPTTRRIPKEEPLEGRLVADGYGGVARVLGESGEAKVDLPAAPEAARSTAPENLMEPVTLTFEQRFKRM